MPAECRSCHTPVDWAEPAIEGQKRIPVDHSSAGDPGGNVEVWRDGPVLYYRVLRKGEEPAPGHYRGISHFASCPEAGSWRRRGQQ